MNEAGTYTRAEILSQPEVWTEVLGQMDGQAAMLKQMVSGGGFGTVLFTGCGSTYYLSLAAAATFQQLTGMPSRGIPASEIWLNPASAYPTNTQSLLVAVSRSGETTETVRAVEAFKQRGHGQVLTMICYPQSPLASMGDQNIIFAAGQEESVAQTRAFTALYLATAAFAAIIAGRSDLLSQMKRLPVVCKRLLADHAALACELGTDPAIDRYYFLGSGPRYGLACEVSLKMKEMSLSHSEPFHFMEFRHGPMSMVSDSTLVVGLLSEANHAQEQAVLDEMRTRGARILALGEHGADVTFHSGLDELVYTGLYLPVLQLLAFQHSLSRGLNPDQPHNLHAVVKFS